MVRLQNPKDTRGALPKYIQLCELIIREIEAGRLLDAERLPPEREMARSYGVSIGTLRKALSELQQKGLLDRVQGSGNYIRHAKEPSGVYAMFRLELPGGGGLPSARILSLEVMEKPTTLPRFGRSDQATRIRRLRFLNEIAIAVEEIWLDAAVGTLNTKTVSDSLYQTYLKHLRFWITRAEDRVTIGRFPHWTPADFAHKDHVCGYVERFGWSDHPAPVEFSRTWFDPDRAVYVQRLK